MLKIPKIKEDVNGLKPLNEFYKNSSGGQVGPKKRAGWKVWLTEIKWFNNLEKLDPVERCIFITLMFYDRLKGDCFPSAKTIAKNLGKSSKIIYTHLEIMRKKGFVKIAKKKGKVHHYKIKI